jgi:hypothetical protein
MVEHERTADYWQDKHRALENAVYNSEHDIVPCVQCGCKIVAPLLADSPRCKDCREGVPLVDIEAECRRLQAELGHGRDERAKLRERLAAAEARISELTKQLALRCRAETCDKEELLAENIELRAKLAAAEAAAHFIWDRSGLLVDDRHQALRNWPWLNREEGGGE